jgi:polysaccharide pyruvyl transferase WcaK-like protein
MAREMKDRYGASAVEDGPAPAVPRSPVGRRRIGLLAHVGRGNLGDEATIAALIHELRRKDPEGEISCFSFTPSDTRERHHVAAFPLCRPARTVPKPSGDDTPGPDTRSRTAPGRSGVAAWVKSKARRSPRLYRVLRHLRDTPGFLRDLLPEAAFLARSLRILRRIDVLVIGGGGQLGDYFGGPWDYPLTIFKWAAMARLTGCRLVFLSVGAGPIVTTPGRILLRWALDLAHYRSFRDDGSRALVESIGARGPHRVFPDLVHSLPVPRLGRLPKPTPPGSALVVGINPIPYFDRRYWAEHRDEVYRDYLATLARFGRSLIESGHRVILFPTQFRADPPVIAEIESLVRQMPGPLPEGSLTSAKCAELADLLTTIATMDVVVASRFHGVVFSLLLGKPVLGLAYQPKTEELMAMMGQAAYSLTLDSVNVDHLRERFSALERDLGTVAAEIEDKQRQCRIQLDLQYELLFSSRSGNAAMMTPARPPKAQRARVLRTKTVGHPGAGRSQ